MDEDVNFFDEVSDFLKKSGRMMTVWLVNGQQYPINPSDDVSVIGDVVFIYRSNGSRTMFPLFQICSIDHSDRF
jgi:hypothetical protein